MTRYHSLYLDLSLIILTVFISLNMLNAQTVELTGRVTDRKDNPIGSVLVSYSRDGSLLDSVRSDASGNYALQWGIVGIRGADDNLPHSLSLEQNYPNPLNPSTTIEFSTPEKGEFIIYNLLGQEIDRISIPDPGSYSIKWNGVNRHGRSVAAGIYFYSLQTDSRKITKKMALIDGGNSGPLLSLSGTVGGVTLSVRQSSDTLSFSGSTVSDIDLPVTVNMDTVINAVLNRAPYCLGLNCDPLGFMILVNEVMELPLSELFYNDDATIYSPLEYIQSDSLFVFSSAAAGEFEILITATDEADTTLRAFTGPITFTVIELDSIPHIMLPDLTIAEDTVLIVLIENLNDYAVTPDMMSPLSFTLIGQSNPALVNLVIDSTRLLIDSLRVNGFGESVIGIEA